MKRVERLAPPPETIRKGIISAIQAAPPKPPKRAGRRIAGQPSVADFIRSMRGEIRQLLVEKNYTLRDAYDLIRQHGLQIEFSTFKGYLYQRKSAPDRGAQRFFGVARSKDAQGSARHDDEFADSILPS